MPRDFDMDVQNARHYIKNRIHDRAPKLALMLGSGLGALAEQAEDLIEIPYEDINGFPVPTVEGHEGKLVFARLAGQEVLFLKGRVHAYETDDFAPYKTLIRTVKALGVERLFTTSSSGSLHPEMPPGSIMLITDHINLMGVNPLLGRNESEFGPRFPDMGDAWSRDMRALAQKAAAECGIPLHEGVYAAFRGPCFETPAEIKMARILGGDAVGMSAVPENIIANHCGLTIGGCAVITNFGAGMVPETLTHEQTLAGAKLAFDNLSALIKSLVALA